MPSEETYLEEAGEAIMRAAVELGGAYPGERTVERFRDGMLEILAGYRMDSELDVHFDASTSMVIVRDIPFFSMCEHHLLPFHGKAHVALIPGKKGVPGLSKYARVVEKYARRLSLQERIGEQVADELVEKVKPKGVYVVLDDVTHMCMSMRGVKAHEANTVSASIRGIFQEPIVRQEALAMLQRRA